VTVRCGVAEAAQGVCTDLIAAGGDLDQGVTFLAGHGETLQVAAAG